MACCSLLVPTCCFYCIFCSWQAYCDVLAGVPTTKAGGNVDPGTCRGAMTSLLQLDNLQDCISGANSDQITKLFPKCRPRDINLNPLQQQQQQTAQQDGQHDHDNNSLLRHRLSVVSVVMDALPSADRCVCIFCFGVK